MPSNPTQSETSAASVIEQARQHGRTILTEVEAKRLLANAGVPVVEAQLASNREEAVALARALGHPVALKIVSPEISHKSDIGGVQLNLDTPEAVSEAHDAIMEAVRRAAPEAAIDGVSVQPMAEPGIEVIMGMTMDAQFGPVLMFGLGGVLVEVLKDVAFRVVPITARDAQQMVREIQGFPVLQGYRGQEAADVGALEELLLKLSQFVEQHPDVAELDLNPVFANPRGAVAVDARIVLSEAPA